MAESQDNSVISDILARVQNLENRLAGVKTTPS
jgi:hypothetical protein